MRRGGEVEGLRNGWWGGSEGVGAASTSSSIAAIEGVLPKKIIKTGWCFVHSRMKVALHHAQLVEIGVELRVKHKGLSSQMILLYSIFN